MKDYELILIFDPALGEEKIGQVVGKIEDKIKAGGGTIEKTEKWGTRRLASMVKKVKNLTQGYYILILFKSEPKLPAELQAYLHVNENVVRSFLSLAVPPESVLPPKRETPPAAAVEVGEIKGEPIGEPK